MRTFLGSPRTFGLSRGTRSTGRPKILHFLKSLWLFFNSCRKIPKPVSLKRTNLITLFLSSHMWSNMPQWASIQLLIREINVSFHAAEVFQKSTVGTPGWVASPRQCYPAWLGELLPSCTPRDKSLKGWGLENVGATWSQTCLITTSLGTWLPVNPYNTLYVCARALSCMKLIRLLTSSESFGNGSINISVSISLVTVSGGQVSGFSTKCRPMTLVEDNPHQTVTFAKRSHKNVRFSGHFTLQSRLFCLLTKPFK